MAPSDAAQADVAAATQEVRQRLWGGLLDATLAARLQPASVRITRFLPGKAHHTSVGCFLVVPERTPPFAAGRL